VGARHSIFTVRPGATGFRGAARTHPPAGQGTLRLRLPDRARPFRPMPATRLGRWPEGRRHSPVRAIRRLTRKSMAIGAPRRHKALVHAPKLEGATGKKVDATASAHTLFLPFRRPDKRSGTCGLGAGMLRRGITAGGFYRGLDSPPPAGGMSSPSKGKGLLPCWINGRPQGR